MKTNTLPRILTLVLAVLLALSATACCISSDEPAGGTLTPAPSYNTPTEPTADIPASTEPAVETTTPTEPVQNTEVSMGTLSGTTYTNTYAGFGCTLDSDWTCLSADQLQELPANIKEILKDTELGNYEVQQFLDMQAENANDFSSVNVLYQQVTLAERLTLATLSEEEILNKVLAEEKDLMIETYAAAGFTVKSLTTKTVTFLGESRTALHMEATIGDIAYYTLQIIDYSKGQYAVTLTAASFMEDSTESLLELFYAV